MNFCMFEIKDIFLKKLLSFTILILFATTSRAQIIVPSIDIDSIVSSREIVEPLMIFIDSSGTRTLDEVLKQPFMPLRQFSKRNIIPLKLLTARFYLRFSLNNKEDNTEIIYAYPGKKFQESHLFSGSKANTFIEKKITPYHSGFIQLEAKPHQTTEFVLKLRFFKHHTNKMDFHLIRSRDFAEFNERLEYKYIDRKFTGLIISGMLLMMILFSFIQYIVSRKKAFLFHTLYSISMSSIVIITSIFLSKPDWFGGFYLSFGDFFLMMTGMIFYLNFTREFLDTKIKYPKLNRFLSVTPWIIAFVIVVYILVHFGLEDFVYETYFINAVKIVLLSIGVGFIVLSTQVKDPLVNFLSFGAATQIFFSAISLFFGIYNFRFESTNVFTTSIFYYELGVMSSILAFIIGLFYKNREDLIFNIKKQESLKLEAEKKSFETQIAILKTKQDERNRISADMHDDLGAGITTIRLYSEIVKMKVGVATIPEIDKISSSANELIKNMNSIIWSMSSKNDDMENLVAYIRSYCVEYLENAGIFTNFNIPDNIEPLPVSGTVRKNIFLVVKEALQNIVKHSKATEVHITLLIEPKEISLYIQDNGIGIDFENLRPSSNGLTNMRKRMQNAKIDFSIENSNGGTLLSLIKKTS